jgi:hypothetical protein
MWKPRVAKITARSMNTSDFSRCHHATDQIFLTISASSVPLPRSSEVELTEQQSRNAPPCFASALESSDGPSTPPVELWSRWPDCEAQLQLTKREGFSRSINHMLKGPDLPFLARVQMTENCAQL